MLGKREAAWLSWWHACLCLPRSEVRITITTNVSLERRLFELMTDEKYRIIHMFHMSLVLQLTLRWFNLLRSVCTLSHLTDRRQASKLDQIVTVQCSVVINNHTISIHNTTRIYDRSGPIAKCHSSEDGCFIMWTQAGHQFVKINYEQVRLSIADTHCCIRHVHNCIYITCIQHL